MRGDAIVALALLAGCGPDAGTSDAAILSADATTLSADATTAEHDAGPSCAVALEDDAPFAAELTGSFTLHHDLDPSVTEDAHEVVHAWFPAGRRPGASVWFSHPVSWPYATVTATPALLSSSGDLRSFRLRGSYSHEEFRIDGRLASPEHGVDVEAWRNVAFAGTDVVEGASGVVRLCPTGDAPPAQLTVIGEPVMPLSTIVVVANVPWETPPRFELWSEGAPVDVSVEDRRGSSTSPGGYDGVYVMAIRPNDIFPVGRPLELRAEGRDVIGRPYELENDGMLVVAAPTEIVSDLSLATSPPEGSHAGAAGVIRDQFHVRNDAIVAFGEPPPGATALRIDPTAVSPGTAGVRCGGDGAVFALVTSGGSTTARRIGCDAIDESLHLAIPGPGAIHLVVQEEVVPELPQYGPPYFDGVDYAVERFAFE